LKYLNKEKRSYHVTTNSTPTSLHTPDCEKLPCYSTSYTNMTKREAQKILAQQKEGITHSYRTIAQALVLTGDGVSVK